jgi:hypothetical protein
MEESPNTVSGLQIIKRLDNRLNLMNTRTYNFQQGAQVSFYNEFPNQSATIGSSINITCNPSTSAHVVSRDARKIATFELTITGTTTDGSPLLKQNYHAPAQYPISSVTQNESLTIGQSTVTQNNVNVNFRALQRYDNEPLTNGYINSTTPSMLDQSQRFQDVSGSSRDPLSSEYGDNSTITPRGAHPSYVVVSNTETQAVVRFTCNESLTLSPFVAGDYAFITPGFAGVSTMSYSCAFGDLSLCWSAIQDQDGTSNITNVNARVVSFALGFTFLQPHRNVEVPRHQIMSYYRPELVSTRLGSPLAPGEVTVMPQAVIDFQGIPSRIYIWADDDVGSFSPYKPHTFLTCNQGIGQLQVSANGTPSIQTLSRDQLYLLSRNNGCNMEYSQFTKHCGSVIALNPGSDINLNLDQAPGVSQRVSFTFNYSVVNTGSYTYQNPVMNILIIYSGLFEIRDGVSSWRLNPLLPAEVAEQPLDLTFNPNKITQDIWGGNILSRMKDAFQTAKNFAKRTGIISKGAMLLGQPEVAAVAKSLGYGITGGAQVSGGRINRRQLS